MDVQVGWLQLQRKRICQNCFCTHPTPTKRDCIILFRRVFRLNIFCFTKYTWVRKWASAWQNLQNGMRPAKTQISLGIRPVWSESLLSLATRWTHSEDWSDRRMPRLILVFAGRTCHVVGFVKRWLKYYIVKIHNKQMGKGNQIGGHKSCLFVWNE